MTFFGKLKSSPSIIYWTDQTISIPNNCAISKTCCNLLSQLCVQVQGFSYLNCLQHYVANTSPSSNAYDFQSYNSYVIALAIFFTNVVIICAAVLYVEGIKLKT